MSLLFYNKLKIDIDEPYVELLEISENSLFLAKTRELLRNNSKDSGGYIAKFSPAALAKFFFEKISKKISRI